MRKIKIGLLLIGFLFISGNVMPQDIQFRLNCSNQSCGFSLKNFSGDTVFKVWGDGRWIHKYPDFVSGDLFSTTYRGETLFNIYGSPSLKFGKFGAPLFVTVPAGFTNYFLFGVMRGDYNDMAMDIQHSSGYGYETRIFGRLRTEHIKSMNGSTDITFESGVTFEGTVTLLSGGCYTGTWQQCSDGRLKKNIMKIDNALARLSKLQGINYNWRKDEYPDLKLDNNLNIGFTAQNVEEVLPEAVRTESNGFKSVSYTSIIPLTVEAIKDQQKIIDKQEKTIDKLENEVNRLESSVESLNKKLTLLETKLNELINK